MTQNQKILAYLDAHGSITPAEAFLNLSILRLASRIHELKRMGIRIEKTMESGVNKDGDPVTYARYKKAC